MANYLFHLIGVIWKYYYDNDNTFQNTRDALFNLYRTL